MKHWIRMFVFLFVVVFGGKAVAQLEAPLMIAQDDSLPVAASRIVDLSPSPVRFHIGSFFDVFTELTLDFSSSPRFKVPAPGSSLTRTMTGTASFRLSLDGGATTQSYQCQVDATVHVVYGSDDGTGTTTYDTEMLSLSLSGGSLPPGVMIRESPTLASTGKVYIRESPTLQRIGSFFDIFTEMSVDGGSTWNPSDYTVKGYTVNARSDTPIGVDRASVSGVYGGDVDGDGAMDFVLSTDYDQHSPPILATQTMTTMCRLYFSLGGSTVQDPNAEMTMRITHTHDQGSTQFFDTEMLSMKAKDSSSPIKVMVRESPSKASLGRVRLHDTPGPGSSISSFFDVFTEVSIDGGSTWTPQDPILLWFTMPHLTTMSLPSLQVADLLLPVSGSVMVDPTNNPMEFRSAGFFDIFTEISLDFSSTSRFGRPAINTALNHPYSGEARFRCSLDGGSTYQLYVCPIDAMVRISHDADADGDEVFDTEMLSMSLSGGTLPGGVMIRESPSKASLGRTSFRESPTRPTRIGSFFDIFTELSLDGGGTWTPAESPIRLECKSVIDPPPSPSSSPFPTGRFTSSEVSVQPQLSNLKVFYQRTAPPGPPLHGTLYESLDCDVTMQYDGDARSVSHAPSSVQMTHTYDDASGLHFDTEMLQLDLSGGTLPPGVMLRESPTLASTGKTTVRMVADSGYWRTSSFFDIFTELSVDGGATWTAQPPSTLQYTDSIPAGTPPPEACLPGPVYPDDLYPPVGVLEMKNPGPPQLYSNGMGMGKAMYEWVSSRRSMPPLGGSDVFTGSVECDAMISMGPGSPPVDVHFSGNMIESMLHSVDDEVVKTFDTEMLSLDLTGSSSGLTIMLRESPTKQSLGKHTVRPNAGGFRINSFFDVFTEISTDGGGTWSPSNGSMRLVQELPPPMYALGGTTYPPTSSKFTGGPACVTLQFSNGAALGELSFFDIFTELAYPPPGGSTTGTITARGPRQSVSLDGGFTFHDEDCDVSMTVSLTPTNTTATDHVYETEMLSMSITGHGGGGGGGSGGTIMLRESPTLQSTGKTFIRESPTLPSRISSFFDVFLEMSLDGGATWSPALDAMRLEIDSLRPASIAGTKWLDANGDGVHDAGENGLPGWTVVLSDTNGTTIDSTVTGPTGAYSFTNVPSGIYRLFEKSQPGWIQTGGSPAYGTWVLPGDVLTGFDFGNFKGSSLTGVKFNDANGDGVRDPGEEGLRDWEICLVPKTSPPLGTEASTVTADFSMRLNGLPPGVPVTGALIGAWLSKRGYDYYQAQSQLKSRSELYTKFENGDIPTEMLSLDLHSTTPVQIGSEGCDLTIQSSRIKYKGWDGTIKGLRAGETSRSSFFDVFFECIVSPRDHSSGLPTGKRMHGVIHVYTQLRESPTLQLLQPDVVYTSDPTEMFDEDGSPAGTMDALSITIGQPASPSNPICVKTDSSGVYNFDPVLPGTWTLIEHQQPCWDQTTPTPAPIVVTSNPAPDCASPDNGTGTADLPAQCAITGGKMMMIDGLPAGTTTASDAMFDAFGSVTRTPGGPLGGEHDQFSATLHLDMQGAGDLAAFHRIMSMPVLTTIDYAPRTPGMPVQSFACDIAGVQGQITGDPDFDLLRITAGSSFGMPSPGHTTLTKSSGGTWTSQGFFDITYRIDFVGHPGGPMGGMSGSTTGTIRITQGGGSSLPPIDIGNHERQGTISIAKYEDINHNQIHDIGEPAMSGVTFVLTNVGSGGQQNGQTDGSGMLSFTDLPSGDYHLTENVPSGYTVIFPKSKESFFTINDCDTQKTTWLDAAAFTDTAFRTATYEDWATAVDAKLARKPIKCKPDKVDFKLDLAAPTTATPVSIVELKFSMPVDLNAIWADGGNKQIRYCYDTTKTTVDVKRQLWRIDLNDLCNGGLPPVPGHVFQIDGIGHKGAAVKVSYAWFTKVPGSKAVIKGSLPAKPIVSPNADAISSILRLPMPNLVNVLDELQDQLVFPIVIGGVVGDVHSVYLKNYSDLLKSLGKALKGGSFILHDSTNLGECFDSLGGKIVKKQVKGILPEKIQHRLFAEALTLKLNILASQHRKFPAGLDTLIYDYHKVQPGPFDGKSVAEILRQTEAYLSCKPNPKPGTTAADYFFVLRRINGAFSGPIDTIRWSCLKLELTGVHTLKEIPFLRANPGSFASYVEAPKEAAGLAAQPATYALMQNYPNPFNPTTMIEFELAEASEVTLKIYNTLGQEVATLLSNAWMEDGSQSVEFDAGSLPSGVYFYRIVAQGIADEENGVLGQKYVSVKKMILVK